MAGRFENKVVLITGASSGIGAAAARVFAAEGARVALAARRKERLEDLCSGIEADGGQACAVECDVTDRGSVDRAVAATVERWGCLDVVLANAGFGVTGVATELDTEDYRRQFETNVFGVLETVHATLPHLIERKGRLGLVASVSGRIGTPASGPYCASKFAVAGLAECLYYDLADLGVSVTCINPGFVESEIRSINNRGEPTGKPDPVPQWLVMPTDQAARQMVRALYKRKPEVMITRHAKLTVAMNRHFPRLVRAAIRLGSRGRVHKTRKAKAGAE